MKSCGTNQTMVYNCHSFLSENNSFVRPVTEYAAPVWSGALTNHDKSSIERIQKRALRIIMGHEYTTYHDVLSMGDLVSLEERRSSLCVSFIEKTLKNTSQFRQFLLPEVTNTRSRRKQQQYAEPHCKTTRMQKSAIPYLVHLLNSSES